MPENQAGREITMRVKKIIATGIVTMTMFAMTACQGSASNQTADSTNAESTVQTATKTQLQTPAATKAPETAKAEEKTTVTQTAAVTQAATQAVTVASEAATEVPEQSVTEEATSAVTAIDYSNLKKVGWFKYVPGEEAVLSDFIDNVGKRTVAYGETIDLSDCMDFSKCSGDTINSIKLIIINHFVDWDGSDYDRDINLKKIIATYSYKKYSAVEIAFKLDTDDNMFCLYAREY